MRRFVHAILVLCAVALLAPGCVGLRSLHLAHAAGSQAVHAACDHGHDGRGDHDGDGDEPAPHDELSCATCELLLSLAGTAGAAIEVPAFHALVAVRDDGAPARLPAPLPPRALAARPPPGC